MKRKICLVHAGEEFNCAPFVRAHVEQLPADVTMIPGFVPHVHGRPALSQSLLSLATRKLYRKLRSYDWSWEVEQGYYKAFQICRPEAVLVEFGVTAVRAMNACEWAGVPLIAHFHGDIDSYIPEVLNEHKSTYPVLFRKASAVIAVSRDMRRQLISLGAPPEKVHFNPCGVDCSLFQGADPANAPPHFVAVGRFAVTKGPFLTLLAFSRVHAARPEARLTMIGSGVLLGPCKDLARGLKIDHAVTFLGKQSHQQIKDVLARSRAYAQHFLEAESGDREGTPVSVLEASASGLPVVSTRHAGIPDVVTSGETGYLVAEHDVDEMVKRMLEMVDRPELAGRMGAAGRQYVLSNFSMEHSIGRLWAIIEGCIVAHQTGAAPPRSAECDTAPTLAEVAY